MFPLISASKNFELAGIVESNLNTNQDKSAQDTSWLPSLPELLKILEDFNPDVNKKEEELSKDSLEEKLANEKELLSVLEGSLENTKNSSLSVCSSYPNFQKIAFLMEQERILNAVNAVLMWFKTTLGSGACFGALGSLL